MKLALIRAALAALLICALGAVAGRAIPTSYPRAVANVFVSEGGEKCTNHPADPGGWTKYGVTLKDVRAYVDAGATGDTVCALTADEAHTIYHDKYWLHRCVRGDVLPSGVDYSAFDYAVNAGVLRPGLILRRLLGVNTDRCDVSDGLLAVVVKKDAVKLIRAIATERRKFYDNLITQRPKLAVFRNGWMARADSVEKISLTMAGVPPERGLFGEDIETEPAFGPGKAILENNR